MFLITYVFLMYPLIYFSNYSWSQHFPGEIKDGLTGNFEGAAVTVNFFLHEQFESELDQVARAFRLETQIIETDKYDVHMVSLNT